MINNLAEKHLVASYLINNHLINNHLIKYIRETIVSFPLLLLIILLTGCATQYYGYTEEEWHKLPEEQKMAIASEYEPLIKAKKEREHSDKIETRKQSIIDFGSSKSRY